MALVKVPNLEDIILQKECLLKNPRRKVPKAIGFAGVDIWLPRYINLGCAQFIKEIDEQLPYDEVVFLATWHVREITLAYIYELADLAGMQAAYFATDEVMSQKRKNLQDIAFLGIAKLALERAGMTTDKSYGRIIDALIVSRLYTDGKLN